jgi:transcriptional regulator NrdR family protein
VKCPECKSPMEVLRTTTAGEGFRQKVRRRLRCLHCKERFSSVERLEGRKSARVAKRGHGAKRDAEQTPPDELSIEDEALALA